MTISVLQTVPDLRLAIGAWIILMFSTLRQHVSCVSLFVGYLVSNLVPTSLILWTYSDIRDWHYGYGIFNSNQIQIQIQNLYFKFKLELPGFQNRVP